MMTRRLLAFFAPGMLMAQDITPHYTVGRFRPLNGECPVCGTMAKPYHEGTGSTQEAFYPWAKYSRLTICEHCNTVFRQWAEGKEPKR